MFSQTSPLSRRVFGLLASPIAQRRVNAILAQTAVNVQAHAVRFNSNGTAAKKPFPAPNQNDEETPLTETVRDFLDPADLCKLLKSRGMDFYTGVPDSLLKDFCGYVSDNCPPENHVITANEGSAIAVASGYHLATKKYPIVYMQNSGFGNAVNPLLSLCDPKVYSIPMLLLIGWRGEPGKKDEPQHLVQGKVMSSLLADMNIHFEVLPDFIEGATEAVDTAIHHLENRPGPYAFLVKRQCFTKYKMKNLPAAVYDMNREDALKVMMPNLGPWDIVVGTTGFLSRELYEYRDEAKQDHKRDFLTVGSMGHASAIALGTAMSKPSRQVWCLDGDGALLMHMGTMATIGQTNCSNFKHVLFNNGAHDSVGGQPTNAYNMNFCTIAKACGYKYVAEVTNAEQLAAEVNKIKNITGPVFLEIKIKTGARKNLGRPKKTPLENKVDFMRFLEG